MVGSMASNQDTLLLGCGSDFDEDSFLLSDYLHHQAERAGNRLFSNKNSLMFLRSKVFLSQLQQEEEEKGESMTVGLIAAQKESSESFSGKECSSNVLSDSEQQKGNCLLSQRSLVSCNSCIESSAAGCESESGFEALTKADIAKAESSHDSLLCSKAKEENSISGFGTDYAKAAADNFPTAKYNTEALDLLVFVAMHANGCNPRLNPSSPEESDASGAHGNSLTPILRKKVVRRAKNAFQTQLLHDSSTHKFKFSEFLGRKENKSFSQDRRVAPAAHGNCVIYAKQRKLQDSSPDVTRKSCTIEDIKLKFCANREAIPTFAVQTVADHGNVVNYRKLQMSSSRLFGVDDAERAESTHAKTRWPKCPAPPISLSHNLLRFEVAKGLPKNHSNSDCNRDASLEKLSKANQTVRPGEGVKQVNLSLRLETLPVRQLNEDFTSGHNFSKSMVSGSVDGECQMVTRKRSAQHYIEKEKARSPITTLPLFRQQTVTQMGLSQVVNGTDPVMMRTKRGRSQVLPNKFSDSVLQPWKRSRRKTDS